MASGSLNVGAPIIGAVAGNRIVEPSEGNSISSTKSFVKTDKVDNTIEEDVVTQFIKGDDKVETVTVEIGVAAE